MARRPLESDKLAPASRVRLGQRHHPPQVALSVARLDPCCSSRDPIGARSFRSRRLLPAMGHQRPRDFESDQWIHRKNRP